MLSACSFQTCFLMTHNQKYILWSHSSTHTHTKPKPCKQHFTYYTQCTVIFSGIFCSMGFFLLFLKWLLDLLNCFYGPHFLKYCSSSVHSDDDLMQEGMLLFSSLYWYWHADCAACPGHSLARLRQGLQPEGAGPRFSTLTAYCPPQRSRRHFSSASPALIFSSALA